VAGGFSGYEDLAAWLDGQGYEISKSALHRYGQGLQQDFEHAMADVKKATELARAYAQSDEDERAALTEASARIAQEQLLRILIGLRKAEDEPGKAARYMAQVSRAIAELGRLTISHKKWREEERRRMADEAADTAAAEAKRAGLSTDAVEAMRAAIMKEMIG
jgi:hypothetical protein